MVHIKENSASGKEGFATGRQSALQTSVQASSHEHMSAWAHERLRARVAVQMGEVIHFVQNVEAIHFAYFLSPWQCCFQTWKPRYCIFHLRVISSEKQSVKQLQNIHQESTEQKIQLHGAIHFIGEENNPYSSVWVRKLFTPDFLNMKMFLRCFRKGSEIGKCMFLDVSQPL